MDSKSREKSLPGVHLHPGPVRHRLSQTPARRQEDVGCRKEAHPVLALVLQDARPVREQFFYHGVTASQFGPKQRAASDVTGLPSDGRSGGRTATADLLSFGLELPLKGAC